MGFDHLLTPTQAAQRAGVHVETVTRWFDNGLLDGIRTAGGHRRIDAESLDELVSKTNGKRIVADNDDLPDVIAVLADDLYRWRDWKPTVLHSDIELAALVDNINDSAGRGIIGMLERIRQRASKELQRRDEEAERFEENQMAWLDQQILRHKIGAHDDDSEPVEDI